jgi:uncharacterized protein
MNLILYKTLPLLIVLLSAKAVSCYAQSYSDSIQLHRQHYKEEFITEERSPLKGNDTTYLRFFAPNEKYRVTATFKDTPESKVFDMPTHSGKTKPFKLYGIISFTVKGKKETLHIYQNQNLLKDPKHKDHLFIPFTDATSNVSTYGGGRYIDLSTSDIQNDILVLDFNKCYNPYCAYADGYNCPIPPVENRLSIAIEAGEKNFGKEH